MVAWWASGAQAAQLLKDGEADMVAIWNGRAGAAIKDGAHAAITYNQGIFNTDCLVIPKGAKNVALAQKAIALMLSPDLQAKFRLISTTVQPTRRRSTPARSSAEQAVKINSSPVNAAKQTYMNSTTGGIIWRS